MYKLIKLFTIILFSAFAPLNLFGQLVVTISIEGLRNSKGKVLLELNDENGKKVLGFNQPIENKKCLIIVKDLKPGNYAFKYFHDENNNEKLDTNFIGIPREGYGFSNNAGGKFGPPAFEKTVFTIERDSRLSCNIIYF